MKKDTFEKLNLSEINCKTCHRTLEIKHFTYRNIDKNLNGECRSCQWLKNNSSKFAMLSSKYDKDLLIEIVRFIFESEYTDLNILVQKEQVTLDKILDIVDILKIGNKKLIITNICRYCDKKTEYTPSGYRATKNHYCSHECYYKDKHNTSMSGENSIYYKRISTSCTNCNKPMKIIPYRYSLKNRFGDNHNFCSKQCYWEYRSKYYVGSKSSRDLVDWDSPELKDKMRKSLVKRLSSENRLNSHPQLMVNNFLDNLGIGYIREYGIKYYSVDNYLTDSKLMIEVMGDYWHANPCRFNSYTYGLNEKQLDGIHRDKLKYSYIKTHYDIEVLYLWEYDIENNSNTCIELIKKYVENKGLLDDYNSFNYELSSHGMLKIRPDIIIPYKDKNIEQYKPLCTKFAS